MSELKEWMARQEHIKKEEKYYKNLWDMVISSIKGFEAEDQRLTNRVKSLESFIPHLRAVVEQERERAAELEFKNLWLRERLAKHECLECGSELGWNMDAEPTPKPFCPTCDPLEDEEATP